MSKRQWDDNKMHFDDHISWPTSKKEIKEACNGEDVPENIKTEINKIPDKMYSTPAELKAVLVN